MAAQALRCSDGCLSEMTLAGSRVADVRQALAVG